MIDVPDGNLTQAEVDAMVTDQCMCPEAKSQRRKAETEAKIADFIEAEVTPEAQDFVRAAVDMVRSHQCESATIQTNDGWKICVKLSKDFEIVFSCKKSLSKKAVI
jgi:hypothetical protein